MKQARNDFLLLIGGLGLIAIMYAVLWELLVGSR